LDFRAAAEIHRAVRRTGRTIRSSVDCLIAAIALRHDVELLHKDVDFEVIAEVTELKQRSLRDH
jgi:predicted nucleic acid-binding protein